MCDLPIAGLEGRASSKTAVATLRRVLVTVTLLFTAALLMAQSPRQAVELALGHDSTVKSAGAGAQAAQLEADAAGRSYLPTLTLGGNYQYTTATADLTLPTGPGQTKTISLVQQHTVDTAASLRWAVFTGFAQQANAELKHLSALLATSNLHSTRNQIALRTVTAYRQAQAAQLQIDSLNSGRERTELQLAQTKALQEQGMAKEVDVLSLRISRLDFDQRLIAAKANLTDAMEQLRSLTGEQIALAAVPSDGIDLQLPSLQLEAVDRIRALGIQRSMAETSRKLAQSKYYPTLSLSGALHYGLPGVNPVQNEWMLYGTAGVSLSWSYDWGQTDLSVRAAERNMAKAASDESAAREAVRLEFDRAVRDWKAMKEEADVLKASLDLSRTRMNIVKSQLEQGMASTTDFTDSNLELTQAELRYRSQLLSLLLKVNQIDALSGEPIENWSTAQ